MVETEVPGCLVQCQFETVDYDIEFGLFQVKPDSELSQEVEHDKLETLLEKKLVDSHAKPVRVNFHAKEAGLYKFHWSNEHSWFNSKTLRYRIDILIPKQAVEEEGGALAGEKAPLVPHHIHIPKSAVEGKKLFFTFRSAQIKRRAEGGAKLGGADLAPLESGA